MVKQGMENKSENQRSESEYFHLSQTISRTMKGRKKKHFFNFPGLAYFRRHFGRKRGRAAGSTATAMSRALSRDFRRETPIT